MKQLNQRKARYGTFAGGLSAVIIALIALLSLPVTQAAAAGPDPASDQVEQAYEPGDGIRLEIGLKRAEVALANAQNWLGFGRDVAQIIQTRIGEQKAQGKDTTAVETALADYGSELDKAEALLGTAEDTLTQKAGFDADGKVTDRQQARNTLLDAARSLRDADVTMRRAQVDLRQAIADYLRQNRPAQR